ncbi:hypothetical protein BC629DRAFT_846831 [Irpex lacteus]|nr:hypothetical protein BC629DRAFT_846831 [Irpex lacteus]
MSAVQDSLEQAQDFIRLLRTENNALRKQVQELQNGTAHSTSKLPSYEEVDVVESLRKQCHDLQGEKQALENEVASLKNGPCKDPSHAYDTERAEFLSKQLSDTLFLKKEQEYLLRERISELEKTCRELEEKLRGQQPKVCQSEYIAL